MAFLALLEKRRHEADQLRLAPEIVVLGHVGAGRGTQIQRRPERFDRGGERGGLPSEGKAKAAVLDPHLRVEHDEKEGRRDPRSGGEKHRPADPRGTARGARNASPRRRVHQVVHRGFLVFPAPEKPRCPAELLEHLRPLRAPLELPFDLFPLLDRQLTVDVSGQQLLHLFTAHLRPPPFFRSQTPEQAIQIS
ncbi:MAG: hypothetical protein ABIH26_07915 [Candidatus Eisenbacteria bacterium]